MNLGYSSKPTTGTGSQPRHTSLDPDDTAVICVHFDRLGLMSDRKLTDGRRVVTSPIANMEERRRRSLHAHKTDHMLPCLLSLLYMTPGSLLSFYMNVLHTGPFC